ncbi:MAG: hypothetical protein J6Y37_11875, partial [Paludibacteraceae bacterium]|nr:hypothetical protein [Paludibacteraceae bacterium]
ERSSQTVDDIIALGADNTRIYPTLVIKGTKLAELYESGRYQPLSLDEAVRWAKDFYLRFESKGVNILRVGLHASEELSPDKSLLAGPYHKSFKELMMTEIWSDILHKELYDKQNEQLTLEIHPSQINYAWGYAGKNKRWFEEMGLEIKIIGKETAGKYEVKISRR